MYGVFWCPASAAGARGRPHGCRKSRVSGPSLVRLLLVVLFDQRRVLLAKGFLSSIRKPLGSCRQCKQGSAGRTPTTGKQIRNSCSVYIRLFGTEPEGVMTGRWLPE